MVPLNPPQQIAPGLLVYCFSHSLYYANCAQFSEEVLRLAKTRTPAPLDCLCVEAAAIGDVDFSAAEMLRSVFTQLREQGIRLVFTNVSPALHAQFERHGLTELRVLRELLRPQGERNQRAEEHKDPPLHRISEM